MIGLYRRPLVYGLFRIEWHGCPARGFESVSQGTLVLEYLPVRSVDSADTGGSKQLPAFPTIPDLLNTHLARDGHLLPGGVRVAESSLNHDGALILINLGFALLV